jgi:hypothetical protein
MTFLRSVPARQFEINFVQEVDYVTSRDHFSLLLTSIILHVIYDTKDGRDKIDRTQRVRRSIKLFWTAALMALSSRWRYDCVVVFVFWNVM